MPPTHHAGFQPWEVALSLTLLGTAWIYLRGWVRVRRLEPAPIDAWRLASFLLGLLLTWMATASALGELDHDLLTFHMVQHLLLMTLVPPLIWLGAPVKAIMQGLPQPRLKATRQWVRSDSAERLAATITRPAVGWLAASGALIGWHIPSLFALGMRSELWHGIEQISFLSTGLLFWWPVIRPWPSDSNSSDWSILLYLFLATLPCDILSGFLVFCDRVVYPLYLSSPRLFGFSALEDQQCAGALMWTAVTVVYLVAGTIFAARLLAPAGVRRPRVEMSGPQLNTVSEERPRIVEIA
jgi:putative membrane protein